MSSELFNIQEITNLWQDFCSLHMDLYELTCEEYSLLIKSELDELASNLEKKNNIISTIKSCEDLRQEYIKNLDNGNIKTINELYIYLDEKNLNNEKIQIEKLNYLLLDIIEKIQTQNKKNKIYLNKALLSLQEIKDGFSGSRYKTYGSDGITKQIRG